MVSCTSSSMPVRTRPRVLPWSSRQGAQSAQRSNVELSWGGGEKIQPAQIDKKEMQYLYDADDALVFMDNETYEQIEIPADHLEWERKFMKPNDNVNISMFEGEVLGVILPDKVTLQVTECEPAVKGDTATNALKNAVVETGLQVKVPLFINQDEMIVINTFDGKYSGRGKITTA